MSPTAKMMLLLSAFANMVLLSGLYCVTTARPSALSVLLLALGAALLALAGRPVVEEIERASPPAASVQVKVYMVLVIATFAAMGVVLARSVFTNSDVLALQVLGSVGAVLGFETAFLVTCTWVVQLRRDGRRET